MSADVVVVFYGILHPLANDEIEQCELRQHPLILAARQVGLQHYWGNFATNGADAYQLLVGHKFGTFGAEGTSSLEVVIEELERIAKQTRDQLERAGISGQAALHVKYEPDL